MMDDRKNVLRSCLQIRPDRRLACVKLLGETVYLKVFIRTCLRILWHMQYVKLSLYRTVPTSADP